MRFARFVLLLPFVSAVLADFSSGRAANDDSRPNILLVIADDWSWKHAGAYGDKVVSTPAFDRIAAEGALFTHAFCGSPSCTPSRAALLTGQAVHRLKQGGNLWSFLPDEFVGYPDRLAQVGYHIGHTGKGWGPGTLEHTTREHNPAGPRFPNFRQFLKARKVSDQPFCFWYGSTDPHRPYEAGSGKKAGLDAANVIVPSFFPDTPEVRNDILDYYAEVQRFDRQLADLIATVEEAGQLDHTLVVVTSDNGMPFPRCKANLYDYGAHMPLAMRWPAKIKPGTVVNDFVSLTDLAPTFLEAAGMEAPDEMTGRSILGLAMGESQGPRDHVFIERERHANVRQGDASYPCRAIRTKDFLYIRNLLPDRWPAGDPQLWHSVGPYGDVDDSPTKQFILRHKDEPEMAQFFRLCFAKRPAEELYDLARDPYQVTNVAEESAYADTKSELRRKLEKWMKETGDPRADQPESDAWDKYLYVGGPGKKK